MLGIILCMSRCRIRYETATCEEEIAEDLLAFQDQTFTIIVRRRRNIGKTYNMKRVNCSSQTGNAQCMMPLVIQAIFSFMCFEKRSMAEMCTSPSQLETCRKPYPNKPVVYVTWQTL